MPQNLKPKPIPHSKPQDVVPQKTKKQFFATQNKNGLAQKNKDLEEEIKLLTSYSTDTIYRLDYRNMKYDYISPAVFKLLGFSQQEMKKINFRSLIVETKLVTDGLRTISSFDELEFKRKNGDVGKWQADYLMRTKSGSKIWVSDVSQPWFNDNGKVIGSVGSLRDISDRMRVEQQILFNFEKVNEIDSLTGLISKPAFFTDVEKEIKRGKRTKTATSMVLFDIDGLDEINKEIGTFMGDKAILRVTDSLKYGLREIDTVGRIAGGTFGVLLPDTNIESAYNVASRIRDNVDKAEIKLAGDRPGVKFTVSAGVATTHFIDNIEAPDLYKLAEQRMFIAKSSGRNQVTIEEILSNIH